MKQVGTLYEGTKQLMAWPMSRGEYNAYRGWQTPREEEAEDEGYLVEYSDGGKANDQRHVGYISWSPKDVFERTYKTVTEANKSKETDQPWSYEHARHELLIGVAPHLAVSPHDAKEMGEGIMTLLRVLFGR